MKQLLFSIFMISGIILLQGCRIEQLSPIPKEQTVIMTVNSFDSSITFIDEQTNEILTNWQLHFPVQRATLLDPDHLLLYGKTLPKIYVYQLSTGKKVATWTVNSGIYDIEIDHERKELYATSPETNELLLLSKDGKIIEKMHVGEKPQSLVLGKAKLIVLTYEDDEITIIDLNTKQINQQWKGPERAIDGAIALSTNELWIGGHGKGTNIEHNISIYDLTDGRLLEQIYAPVMPVIFESIDPYMYVLSHGSNELRKIDARSREMIDIVEVGANPFAIGSFNGKLYVAGYDSNDLTIVDANTLEMLSVLPVGEGPIQVLIR